MCAMLRGEIMDFNVNEDNDDKMYFLFEEMKESHMLRRFDLS